MGEPTVEPRRDGIASWGFRPGVREEVTREEILAFGRRRDGALRAAHGLGIGFALHLRAGPEPTLFLEAGGLATRRWVVRTLVPAYGRTSWLPCEYRAPPAPARSWVGCRIRSWPHRLHGPAETSSVLDVWAMAFAALPVGLRLELAFRPLPVGPPRWWDIPAPPAGLPPPERFLRQGRDAVSVQPRPAVGTSPPSAASAWFLVTRLTSHGLRDEESTVRGAAEALERAGRDGQGNGIRFRRGDGWFLRGSGGFPVFEEELGLFLPGRECPVHPPEMPGPPGEHLPLGRTSAGIVVGPRIEPHQGRHLAVLGETGMGKSSLLVALCRRVSQNHGLVLLDPLGATAAAFERELRTEVRRRLLRISPVTAPLRVNALEGISAGEGNDSIRSERRLNDLVHSLRRVRAGRYVDSTYWGPRLEEMLTRAVRAASALPHGTLTDAHTLLESGARVPRTPPSGALGPIRELADRIRERPEDADGARRLLHEIVRSPVLEPMLCARDPDVRPAALVEAGRVVVVSGEAGEVGESTARYLLSVYLALLWSELLARPARAKVFFVLDEAQWFAHDSLAEMLRLGRSANLHVILATQAIASLPAPVAESVWTNVADFVAFRGSPEEARELARATCGVSTEGILALPRGHAVALIGKGQATRWLRTLRLPERAHVDDPTGSGSGRPFAGTSEPLRGEPPTVTVEEVLEELRDRSTSLTGGRPLRVSLEELRASVDPGGDAVRRAGSRLRSAGAILASERLASGTVWTIAPSRIPRAESSEGEPGAPSRASPPQPS